MAVSVILVTPTGNSDPACKLDGKYWLVTAEWSSVMLGSVHVTSAVLLPVFVFTIWVDGHGVMVGGVVSVITVNEKEQEAWLPEVSIAEAVTVYVPAENTPGDSDADDETKPTLSE